MCCLRCGSCYECRHCLASCPKEWVVLTSQVLANRIYNLPLRADSHHWFIRPAEQAAGALHAKDKEGNGQSIPVQVESILAKIEPGKCRACGLCLEVCAYEAPTPTGTPLHEYPYIIDEEKCKGCGSCLAVCPTGAIQVGFYTHRLYSDRMDRAIEEAKK